MRWGISGAAIPTGLKYAQFIRWACGLLDFPPLCAYAIACNETIIGEYAEKWNAATIVSADGGHGLFQLTSWWPDPGWDDPYQNAQAAVRDWLLPDAVRWFQDFHLTGEDLVRCVAAGFNAGYGTAAEAHAKGDVDAVTSERYGERALTTYVKLRDTGRL